MSPNRSKNKTLPHQCCKEKQNTLDSHTCPNCGKKHSYCPAAAAESCRCHKPAPQNSGCGCGDKNNTCNCDVDGGVF